MPVGNEIRLYRRVPERVSLVMKQGNGTSPIGGEPIEQKFLFISTLEALQHGGHKTEFIVLQKVAQNAGLAELWCRALNCSFKQIWSLTSLKRSSDIHSGPIKLPQRQPHGFSHNTKFISQTRCDRENRGQGKARLLSAASR